MENRTLEKAKRLFIIHQIRPRRFLYNRNEPYFGHSGVYNQTYRAIARRVTMFLRLRFGIRRRVTFHEVKNIWNSIKGSYKRSYIKYNGRPRYYLTRYLGFLNDHLFSPEELQRREDYRNAMNSIINVRQYHQQMIPLLYMLLLKQHELIRDCDQAMNVLRRCYN